MQLTKSIFVWLIFSAGFIACNADGAGKTKAQKKAEEQSTRNPIQKGRYLCYHLFATGDKIAPELLILSDNMYQVDDAIGHYKYHPKNSEIEWIDGPFYKSSENWVGFFTAKGTRTSGGHTLESMIEIESQKKSSGDWPKIMQCNCAEKE
jgi:hypothetical protein